jgi:hypothetical protein
MKSGMEILRERASKASLELGSTIPESVFRSLGLPMIVSCTNCEATLALPAAYIDLDDQIYCGDCAGVEDDDVEVYAVPAQSSQPVYYDEWNLPF